MSGLLCTIFCIAFSVVMMLNFDSTKLPEDLTDVQKHVRDASERGSSGFLVNWGSGENKKTGLLYRFLLITPKVLYQFQQM